VTLELDSRVFDPDNPQQLAEGECHVRMLGVDPTMRRQGVARVLMTHCIEAAREAGKRVMSVNTSERNVAAQGLYESMGFERGEDLIRPDGSSIRTYRFDL
jgi:ribosomal protein S18 acetylase RimI-like enzyme